MHKPILFVALFLLANFTYSQISGTVKDSASGKPLQYVSVWVKDKPLGATTDQNGNFSIDPAGSGDTLVASFLGFESREVVAEEEVVILLREKVDELAEVVVIPMKSEREKEISSYKRVRQIKEQLAAGEFLQYKAARFYRYQPEYVRTPFIKNISFVTMNTLDTEVPVMLSVVKADRNGQPTDQYILKNELVFVEEGREEAKVDLQEQKLQVPENGFFVVLERVYREEFRLNNRNYIEGKTIKYAYQPSLGTVNDAPAENLWWSYGGNWFSSTQLQRMFPFEKKDLAINVLLTN